MRTFFTMLIPFVVGGVIGAFLALVFGAVGGGVAGLVAGSCVTVETAIERKVLSREQADQLVRDTVARINAKAQDLGKRQFEWNEADCARLVAEFDRMVK